MKSFSLIHTGIAAAKLRSPLGAKRVIGLGPALKHRNFNESLPLHLRTIPTGTTTSRNTADSSILETTCPGDERNPATERPPAGTTFGAVIVTTCRTSAAPRKPVRFVVRNPINNSSTSAMPVSRHSSLVIFFVRKAVTDN